MKINQVSSNQQLKSLGTKRPPSWLTDDLWQEHFVKMKTSTVPSRKKKMTGFNSHHKENEYQGETNIMRYRQFINDILNSIRRGDEDYAYFIYQITDLLKYEPRIKATYLPQYQCFAISL